MKVNKLDGKGIFLTPESALDHNFIAYICEAIEAKETKMQEKLRSTIASTYESPLQDSQPLIIGSQP
jgi:hypothetical protein